MEAKKLENGARMSFESLNLSKRSFKPPQPFIEDFPTLELKPLPLHLKYTYLGENNTFPVVISAELTYNQEAQLLEVLKRAKKVLGWTIADIKGINPTIYMHKNLLEDFHDNSIKQQRRLNPIMKEVVKKEIIKWLNARIIYPISNSSWQGIVIDKAKIDFIDKLPPPTTLKPCVQAFEELKKKLVTTPIVRASAWILPFELMYNANDFVVGAVLGQRKNKVIHAIYYASRMLIDTKGTKNQLADHLPRLEAGNEDDNIQLIREDFPDEQLLVATVLPWYDDIVNFLLSGLLPPELNNQRQRKFFHDAKQYYWDKLVLFKHFVDQIIQKCAPDDEIQNILHHCHSTPYGGHFEGM
ncbi:uncharacterized protein [Gossypium hirsutum]|uniref:Reverse transcriptase/retrotransposon-derived protein RNase H-like domain-containing protein n=1 Tax=Gossypium hirsutum TaxID=3635 RepID=A0A1U8P904_GOSHI|nr:uncharacterized protein LOC107956481 [Gossypium hirsutum]